MAAELHEREHLNSGEPSTFLFSDGAAFDIGQAGVRSSFQPVECDKILSPIDSPIDIVYSRFVMRVYSFELALDRLYF